jgi:hypothetical protein
MRMPSGKYRGLLLGDVPPEYLFWLFLNGDIDDDLWWAIAGILRGHLPDRDCRTGLDEPLAASEEVRRSVLDVLKAAYRETAMRHHPDRGGAPGAMIGVNALYVRFKEILRRPG